jgi:colanic acid biosynthesis protein WcaH
MENKVLSKKDYTKVLASVPVLTVDILIERDGEYLLVKRKNRPLMGKYWIPGGRVYRGENIVKAARRKMREETGLRDGTMTLVGYSNGIWKDNLFGLDYIQTVSIVFLCRNFRGSIKLDRQSSDFKWSKSLPKGCIISK